MDQLIGWIKLHRELMDKPIWKDSTPEQKSILITLLMMANHKGNEWEWRGERYHCEPGQFVTSLPKIAEKAGKGITIQNVRTALKRFESFGFLTDESTNKNRLITIVNWGLYQSLDDEDNSQTNRQLTGNQQATNRQLTANKNDKNNKNERDINNYYNYMHSRAVEFFANNFGQFSSFINDNIVAWEKDLNTELVIAAMKIALKKNKKNFAFVESILREWHGEGIKTLDQARAYESKKWEKPKRVSDKSNRRNKRQEPVPKWMSDPDWGKTETSEEEIQKRVKELDSLLSNL